jgi:NAD(P)-dependent dehydrogenase (short-subunit alcohol dehydrogenase family)
MITGRTEASVDAAVRSLTDEGHPAERVAGAAVDVRDRPGVDRLIADTVRRFDGLDVLVNNAGVGKYRNVELMSDDEWSAILDTNVTGPFYFSRAAIPVIRRAGGGWIINIASLAGQNPFAQAAAYCASKAALIAFSEAMMQEVRFDNIRVAVVLPGSVATSFNDRTVGPDDAWKLTGEDVAQVVVDLLRHPGRSLPSKVEIRPAKPRRL